MAKIDRVEDLPEWFTLEKYRGCESFGAVEWFHSLAVRRFIFYALDRRERGLESVGEQLLADQLGLLRRLPTDNGSGYRYLMIRDEQELAENAPVRPLRIFDLVLQSSADGDAAEDGECAPWFAERWKVVANGVDPFADIWDDPLMLEDHGPEAVTHAAVLAVNLQANDSVLMAAFAAWLKDARIKHPTAKRERPAYGSWAAYGLLPYLDLLIWAKETGGQIPHHVMAEAVGYRKGGDSFRKTVPKLATELMHNLGELEALAAIEATPEKLGA